MGKTIKTGFVLLILFGAGYLRHTASEKESMDKLMLENIEALADCEEGQSDKNYFCFGRGEICCHGDKVEEMYEGISLD